MAKKIIAILATFALIFSFAACGKKDDGATTKEITTTDPFANASTYEATGEAVTDENGEAVTDANGEAVTEADEKDPSNWTTEQIVEYFNTAVNSVKTDAKSVTRNYSQISLNGSTTLPSALNGVLKILGGADKFLGDQLSKNSKGKETYTGKDAIKGVFPVEGETYASVLTADDVQDAQIMYDGETYTIKIVTKADGKSASITHGQGHAPKAFNVILPGVVNDNIPGAAANLVGTATMNYPASTIIITVDAATGHVKTANYSLCWTINFDKAGAILPFKTVDDFVVTY